MNNSNDDTLRAHLIDLMVGGNAHATFDDAVADLPANLRGSVPQGLPYSIWQLVDHIRIAQWDILEFTKDQEHQSPKWPDEYWPKEAEPENEAAWNDALKQIEADKEEFVGIISNPNNNLYQALPKGDGQSILREALLIADHLAYHTAEIIVLRRLLGAWKK